jgi:hypothetical protein
MNSQADSKSYLRIVLNAVERERSWDATRIQIHRVAAISSTVPFEPRCELVIGYRKEWRRGSESNRRIKVLQTSPLPLGYRANQDGN